MPQLEPHTIVKEKRFTCILI